MKHLIQIEDVMTFGIHGGKGVTVTNDGKGNVTISVAGKITPTSTADLDMRDRFGHPFVVGEVVEWSPDLRQTWRYGVIREVDLPNARITVQQGNTVYTIAYRDVRRHPLLAVFDSPGDDCGATGRSLGDLPATLFGIPVVVDPKMKTTEVIEFGSWPRDEITVEADPATKVIIDNCDQPVLDRIASDMLTKPCYGSAFGKADLIAGMQDAIARAEEDGDRPLIVKS